MTRNSSLKNSFIALIFIILSNQLFSQQTDSLLNGLKISLELRPRAEYTYNYALPPNDTVSPFLFITQRNRLSISYARPKWLIKSDFQEIHYWDKFQSSAKVGSINFYQLFVETKFKGLNIRAGRQSVLLDNGRIFSDAPWAQQSRAHEGIRIMHRAKQLRNDLFLLFTRNYGNQFEPTFSPVAAHRYKYLFIHHLNYNVSKAFSFNTINALDIFKNESSGNTYHRFTSGGRIEVKNNRWYYTLNTYLQYGHNPQGKKLLAYYIQPEIKMSVQKSTIRFGAELLSGSSPGLSANQSGDFDVLYGVAWKFMGNMNVFTRFPADVAGKGLINPYLFILLPLDKKISLRSDSHLFYTQYNLLNETGQPQNKYVGFESDISLRYIPAKNLDVNYGFSFLKSSSSMKYLPKIQNEKQIAVWSYLMVSYTLNILHLKPKAK
ncbi:hypothetical protein [Flavihumibacter fluvii]|uniref:hypothetical protein n=1 Tax=Flavihumibacter fluvii TaxID=2838157 RepID=UPI001BDF2C6D|nr:hypothetical protein [Flavihumibacter fluvii]ULQ51785.1 hypothetical protein KJS93_16985 [Flavihumibacter fluvii]